MISVYGQIPDDFANIAYKRVRFLRRNTVPRPQVSIVHTFLNIQPVTQNIGSRLPDGIAIFPVQFFNSLLRALKKQADYFTVFQLRHFLSASPYNTGRENKSYTQFIKNLHDKRTKFQNRLTHLFSPEFCPFITIIFESDLTWFNIAVNYIMVTILCYRF